MNSDIHIPVLLNATVDSLNVKSGGCYVDGTLGRAGHTREIIARGGRVLGIDRDDDAIASVRALGIPGLTVVKGRHGDIASIVRDAGWSHIDGILLDLGVSSPQLDDADRGFSFMREGPLDMRMDRSSGLSAADIVNGATLEELVHIFRDYGEEPQAVRLARAIVAVRAEGFERTGGRVSRAFATTSDLAAFAERVLGRHGGHHPATRAFQALRMAVNDEIGELERALAGAFDVLSPGGRFAVITFESITDRIVKRRFADHVGRMESLQGGGERWRGRLPRCRNVVRKPLVAGAEEVKANPRSRSAKLRVVERGDS